MRDRRACRPDPDDREAARAAEREDTLVPDP
jgi:hypothetical protein